MKFGDLTSIQKEKLTEKDVEAIYTTRAILQGIMDQAEATMENHCLEIHTEAT